MVLFYVLIVCTVTLPPGVNPIAVDKYIYLSKCQKGIGCLGVKVFNKLPKYLKEEFDNPNKFKKSLKNYLIIKTFYSLQEYLEL